MSRTAPLIAIVDDEESVCRALKRLMLSANLQVVTFPSGIAFFEYLETQTPDCVVLDLHMPVMTGFEVQSRLNKLGNKLPVIAITGHDAPETQSRVLSAGACAYLRKPVTDQLLLGAVMAAIQAKQAP